VVAMLGPVALPEVRARASALACANIGQSLSVL
jgi:hypothetical protein